MTSLTEEAKSIVERFGKAAIEPCDGCCYGDLMVEGSSIIRRLSKELADKTALADKYMAATGRLSDRVDEVEADNARLAELLLEPQSEAPLP